MRDDATVVWILALRRAGWVMTRIADTTDTTYAMVQRLCARPCPPHLTALVEAKAKEMGADPGPVARRRADEARILALLAENTPKIHIARRLRCGVNTVRKVARAAQGPQ